MVFSLSNYAPPPPNTHTHKKEKKMALEFYYLLSLSFIRGRTE